MYILYNKSIFALWTFVLVAFEKVANLKWLTLVNIQLLV